MNIRRHPVTSDRRFDVDKDAARGQPGEQLVPPGLSEHPVRHGEDQPVEPVELVEVDQIDAVLAPGFRGVSERVGDPRGNAVFAQLGEDVGDPAVAQIGHVLLEGEADDADPRILLPGARRRSAI